MKFENRVGETERQGDSTVGRQGDAIGGTKPLGEKIKDFVDGVKETPREAVRNISQAAGQAKDQAKDYVEHTTMRGVAEDVAGLIRRYPVQSLLVGMAVGFLASRRRGD
jgi:ElaB/YqjD/DUF883 family membrane-anchored ribosome-binding protein